MFLWSHTGINSNAKRMLGLWTAGLLDRHVYVRYSVNILINFRFTVVLPKSRFASVLFASVLSRFAYVLGLFPVLISPDQCQKERGICMRAYLTVLYHDRANEVYTFTALISRLKTSANGSWRNDRSRNGVARQLAKLQTTGSLPNTWTQTISKILTVKCLFTVVARIHSNCYSSPWWASRHDD